MKKKPGYYINLLKEQTSPISQDSKPSTSPAGPTFKPSTSPAGPTFKPSTSPVRKPGPTSPVQPGSRNCCDEAEAMVDELNSLIAQYNSALNSLNNTEEAADAFGGDPQWFSNNFNAPAIDFIQTSFMVAGGVGIATTVSMALLSPFAPGTILAGVLGSGTVGWAAVNVVGGVLFYLDTVGGLFNDSWLGSLAGGALQQMIEWKVSVLATRAEAIEQLLSEIEQMDSCCSTS